MKPVPDIVQNAMDRIRQIEFELSRADQDKVTRTATAALSGCVETFRREMLNKHGIEVPVLPDSHFEAQREALAKAMSPPVEEPVVEEPDPPMVVDSPIGPVEVDVITEEEPNAAV